MKIKSIENMYMLDVNYNHWYFSVLHPSIYCIIYPFGKKDEKFKNVFYVLLLMMSLIFRFKEDYKLLILVFLSFFISFQYVILRKIVYKSHTRFSSFFYFEWKKNFFAQKNDWFVFYNLLRCNIRHTQRRLSYV